MFIYILHIIYNEGYFINVLLDLLFEGKVVRWSMDDGTLQHTQGQFYYFVQKKLKFQVL